MDHAIETSTTLLYSTTVDCRGLTSIRTQSPFLRHGFSVSLMFNHSWIKDERNHYKRPSESSDATHHLGFNMDWSSEEQAILDDGLVRYASEPSISRYTKISAALQSKSIRDVAMRCRWMEKKETNKRRKEDHKRSGRVKLENEEILDAPPLLAPPVVGLSEEEELLEQNEKLLNQISMNLESSNKKESSKRRKEDHNRSGRVKLENEEILDAPPLLAPPVVGLSEEEELLAQNEKLLNQISMNLESSNFEENRRLFFQARENMRKLAKKLDENAPELMEHMPPLPVELDDELADSIIFSSDDSDLCNCKSCDKKV